MELLRYWKSISFLYVMAFLFSRWVWNFGCSALSSVPSFVPSSVWDYWPVMYLICFLLVNVMMALQVSLLCHYWKRKAIFAVCLLVFIGGPILTYQLGWVPFSKNSVYNAPSKTLKKSKANKTFLYEYEAVPKSIELYGEKVEVKEAFAEYKRRQAFEKLLVDSTQTAIVIRFAKLGEYRERLWRIDKFHSKSNGNYYCINKENIPSDSLVVRFVPREKTDSTRLDSIVLYRKGLYHSSE